MKQQTYKNLINALNLQKQHLGIGHAALAAKAGLSEITVKRILSGRNDTASIGHVLAIAEVLGVGLQATGAKNAETMRRQQAERKAKDIIRLLRGNSALEGQGLSPAAYKRMMDKTVQELLSGPRKKLWID